MPRKRKIAEVESDSELEQALLHDNKSSNIKPIKGEEVSTKRRLKQPRDGMVWVKHPDDSMHQYSYANAEMLIKNTSQLPEENRFKAVRAGQ